VTRPRLLITNCVVLNGGDAAILYALLDRLRAAIGCEPEVVVIDDQPEAVSRRYPGLDARPRLDATFRHPPRVPVLGQLVAELQRVRLVAGAWCIGQGKPRLPRLWLGSAQRGALEAFNRSAAVISTGGTYLVERYPIAGRMLELEVALAMRLPLVLFTQSLGPFTQRAHRRRMRAIASRARLVLVRDELSRRHLADLGVRANRLHVVADAAFALSADPPQRADGRFRVAVSVRDWPYASGDAATTNERYRDAIRDTVEALVTKRGAEVTFISTCQGTPEYWANDAAVAAAIAGRVDPSIRSHVYVDSAFHRPQELLDTLAGFDLVVATRMHMAILALVAGVPVFPIAYESKTRELFDRLQMGQWVRELEELKAPAFREDVERFLDQLPALIVPLREAVNRERRSALATADLLAHVLTSANPESRSL
jgi:colanic acid/amylovoran biosynthesis protein